MNYWINIFLEAAVFAVVVNVVFQAVYRVQVALRQVYKYPPRLRERIMHMALVGERELGNTRGTNRAVGCMLLVVLPLVVVVWVNGVTAFWPAFVQLYIFLNAYSVFKAVVVDCLYFAHAEFWVIPGTEEMVEDYRDYWFHLRPAVMNLGLLAVPAALMALMVVLLNSGILLE